MKFHEYPDSWAIFKRQGLCELAGVRSREELYDFFQRVGVMRKCPLALRHYIFDKSWREHKCPYYDVYPSIIPILTKLDLNIPGSSIVETFIDKPFEELLYCESKKELTPPANVTDKVVDELTEQSHLPHLLIRLPKGNKEFKFTFKGKEVEIKTIFMSFQPVNQGVGGKMGYGLVVGMDIGETVEGIPTYTMSIFPLSCLSIEETIPLLPTHRSIEEGIQIPNELKFKAVKLCLTLRLISNDPNIIQPDVLSKDRVRWKTGDDELKKRLEDKARRRGKNGFLVGSFLEGINPHIRKPHVALYWTGEGRKIPKILMRKGSVVHRDKIEKIPTGYKSE